MKNSSIDSAKLKSKWQIKKLSEICTIQTGKHDANHEVKNGKYRFYTCAYDYLYCNTNRFNGECLILPGNGANVGEVFYYNGEFDAYQRTYVINNIKIYPKYLYYHLLCYWRKINLDKQYGSATNYIRIGNFNEYKIEFPEISIQKTIVYNIELLLSEVENGIKNLKIAQEQLKVYRQSVLKWAFTGRLTNENVKEGDLPKAWKNVKFKEVFDVYVGSTPSRKINEYWNGDINWVSSGEVRFTNITSTKEKITNLGLQKTSCKVHPKGTIILAMIGEGKTRGQTAILNIDASHNQNTAAIRLEKSGTISSLLYYFLVYNYENTRKGGSGNNQKALNKRIIEDFTFPLPPQAEQIKIVNEIEGRISIAEKMEESIDKSLQYIDQLKQSILLKAFGGSLCN